MTMTMGTHFLFLLLLILSSISYASSESLPLDPSTTVPALPMAQSQNDTSPLSPPCHLDLSDELFGGVATACARLDRGRCCPVLAAWLFAAHARTALKLDPTTDESDENGGGPMVPYDNQNCVDALTSALEKRNVELPRPNATCDMVLCFCGIRLHQIGSLMCPAAFSVVETSVNATTAAAPPAARNATPTAAVRELEKSCKNSSYAGCSKCVQSLQKLKGHIDLVGGGDRARRMLGRDCQLMGLTWLLAKNKTAYIPTVSAVLRAMLYSAHPTDFGTAIGNATPKCSPDQENMPLAVNSLQFEHVGASSSATSAFLMFRCRIALFVVCMLHILVQMR